MLTLAGVEITEAEARKHLINYAVRHPATVRYYDYDDDMDTSPSGSNGVAMSDIARLVVINARLEANDIAHLLDQVADALWSSVPLDADFRDLPDDPSNSPLYQAVCDLEAAYRDRGNIGSTKATKLLYLKRPGLVPILDTVAKDAYKGMARATGKEFGNKEPMYWAAIWRDARRNAETLDAICQDLPGEGEFSDPERALVVLVARLPLLRLHDILIWSQFRPKK